MQCRHWTMKLCALRQVIVVGSSASHTLITSQQLGADADQLLWANDVPMGLNWLTSRKRVPWHA